MADQDAQDISQMMSASPEAIVKPPKKSKFLWVVLSCVVLGVGLGVVVYQQSLAPTPRSTPTPRPTIVATPTPTPSATPVATPVVPSTNVVSAVANTMSFPQAGKLRVFSDINNITLVITITTGGQTKTITLPNKTVDATNKMHYVDSAFEVSAGSTGTINAYLNSTSGPKMLGWILPVDGSKCGANGFGIVDKSGEIAYATANLPSGQTLFATQCWADEGSPSDPSSLDFNDFFVAWGYASTTTTASASPSTVASASPSPSASILASATPTATATATPIASPRVTMPDTEGGVPVTGVFEVTAGTISLGLILLLIGLFGLLAL